MINNLMKRGLSLLLALLVCISMLPAVSLQTNAAEITYTYDGSRIYNWGTRGETATELSPNATAFYVSNDTSYTELSSYSGGTSASTAPTSALYDALQDLMAGAQHTYTSYDGTKELYKYTDCQGGGGRISSFYSGTPIGPSWDDDGWNREHTWPKSKGLGGRDANDIMMLRPTSTNENSSRGNTAYGKSGGYYNPNAESGGTYDLRGDVARIFLYVYVRWGNVNGNGEYATWGSNGVMESVAVLLEWMEADPVDTWELGRNDSVESITGTRNVFVDYPELAFLLFGEEIPADMTTPSAAGGPSCEHDNFDAGVIVSATCTEKGYTLFTCQTVGCGSEYKTSFTKALGHSYSSGSCTRCGEDEPAIPTFVAEIVTGKAYKLGFFSTNTNAEHYFVGTMTDYYGTTDTNYDNGVDVFVENATGGYYLYFKDGNGQKKYINLVLNDTHYNFTYSGSAISVFTWNADKNAFYTTVANEICYMGTYGTHKTMSVLRSSLMQSGDYIARMYTRAEDGTGADDPCTHNYSSVVTAPTCTAEGFTTYTCSLCAHSYRGDRVAAKGHDYVNNTCSVCGTVKAASKATISFADAANRTAFSTSQQIWEQNGIKVTNSKAGSQSDVANYVNPARFYKGSSVIIAYPGITKIEINCSGLSSSYVNAWVSDAPEGATATNSSGIVTVVFSAPVDSVIYTGLSSQSRAKDITVYAETETPPSCTHTRTTVEGAASPTCTASGHTGRTRCLDCSTVITEGETLSALGHDWKNATTEAPKTCNRCQKTEGEKLPASGTTPDNDTPSDDGDPTEGDKTPGSGTPPAKDHSQCKAGVFKTLWNSIANFFRRLFGSKEKCVCGEYYSA
ncbi:MAG: endonuclease [Clostridia bacterium]|nr:endonuclease [Clostridia bacterium]